MSMIHDVAICSFACSVCTW